MCLSLETDRRSEVVRFCSLGTEIQRMCSFMNVRGVLHNIGKINIFQFPWVAIGYL